MFFHRFLAVHNETSATYEHVAGCKGGEFDCDFEGWSCSDNTGYEKGLSFNECEKLAKNMDACGFAYKGTHDRYCKMCTYDQVENRVKSRYWGIYSKPGT